MNPDLSSLEAELRELRAKPLDDAFLARLEAAVDGSLVALTPAEEAFESRLRGVFPSPLPAAYLEKLVAVAGDTPFRPEENIVRFPALRPAPVAAERRARPWWSAAAAVALAGAATALLMPPGKPAATPVAANPPPRAAAPPSAAASHLVPAGFNRGISEISDEGVIWKSDNQPQNLVRVVFMDRITLRAANGTTYEVEQPRVEYMLVPAKTD